MRKLLSMILSISMIFSLSACDREKDLPSLGEFGMKNSAVADGENHLPDIEKLKARYPEYFEMSDFKGIEVYVWQMGEDSYRCVMMAGTDSQKSFEEILALESKDLSIDEAKIILEEIGVDKDKIIIIPINHPISSFYYDIDDEYREKVTALFD